MSKKVANPNEATATAAAGTATDRTNELNAIYEKIKNSQTPFETLDVPPNATIQQIQHAYDKFTGLIGPATNPSNEGRDAYKKVMTAYETLTDPSKRLVADFARTMGDFAQQMVRQQLEANVDNFDEEEVEQFRNFMGNIQNMFQQNDPNQLAAGLANLIGQVNPQQIAQQMRQLQIPVEVQPPAAAQAPAANAKVKRQNSIQPPSIKLKRFDVPAYLLYMISTAVVVILVFHFFLSVKPAHSLIKSNDYETERFTADSNVPYYLATGYSFDSWTIRQIERQVESEYAGFYAETVCKKREAFKNDLIERTRLFDRDESLLRKANEFIVCKF